MNSKSYAYLDRYAKLQPHSNFLLYHTNYALTPIELRRKRILAFYLKKLKKFVYSAESDSKILDLCIGILNYLMLSYNPETQKVEAQLLQYLEDLTFIIYLYTQEDEIFTQFFNHLSQLSKRKQKIDANDKEEQIDTSFFGRVVQLKLRSYEQYKIYPPPKHIQYSSQQINYYSLFNFTQTINPTKEEPIYLLHFFYHTDQFQLKQYKEKVLKDKNVSTDMILDLARQTQNEETIEEVLNILRNYKNDFHGADSFLIKKKYFQLAYENGDQLDKEEVMEFLNADLFDLEYVQQIISYVEFFIDDHQQFVKEIILKVLEFSQGNSYLWSKLVRLISKSQENSVDYEQDEEQDSAANQSLQQMGSQDKIISDMEVEKDNNSENESGQREEIKSTKKTKVSKESSKVQFSESDIELVSKVQYSGKYKKKDLNILKKIASQNFSPKFSEENALSQFLQNKYSVLETLLSLQEGNKLLQDYKRSFDELQIKNVSQVLK